MGTSHSSQSGEQVAELKGVLNDAGLRAKAKAVAADEGFDDSADEAMLLTMLKRGRQANISFFAFTVLPPVIVLLRASVVVVAEPLSVVPALTLPALFCSSVVPVPVL